MVDLPPISVDRGTARRAVKRTLLEAALSIGDRNSADTVPYTYRTEVGGTIDEAARTYVAETTGHDPENILVLGIVPPDIYYDVRTPTDEE